MPSTGIASGMPRSRPTAEREGRSRPCSRTNGTRRLRGPSGAPATPTSSGRPKRRSSGDPEPARSPRCSGLARHSDRYRSGRNGRGRACSLRREARSAASRVRGRGASDRAPLITAPAGNAPSRASSDRHAVAGDRPECLASTAHVGGSHLRAPSPPAIAPCSATRTAMRPEP